jgi:ABC-type polysaccharide/polyol phosphate export permease
MSDPMRRIADLLPLTHATSAIRDPWLDDGSTVPHLIGLGVWFVIGITAGAALIRRGDSAR